MKNKAVEAMIRIQFNIPKQIEITVVCGSLNIDGYECEISWYGENDSIFNITTTLPHHSLTCKHV